MSRAALLVLAIAGCGSDAIDLTGMYRVDSAVASEPCGADAPVTMPPMYLRFEKQSFFGADYFAMEECVDEAGTDCSGGGLFAGSSFAEPIDDGWRGVLTGSSSGGASDPTCTLTYAYSTAILVGTTLTVDITRYSEDVDNTAALCTTDEAESRGDAMPCIRHEAIMATKL